MDELDRLALVQKVRKDLDNHLGIDDEDLAEFLVHNAQEARSCDVFVQELLQQDDQFPINLAKNVYESVQVVKGGASVSGSASEPLVESKAPTSATSSTQRVFNGEVEVLPGLAIRDEDHSLAFGEGKETETERRLRLLREKLNRERQEQQTTEASQETRLRPQSAKEEPSRKRPRARTLEELRVGDICDGKVCNVKDFGCFIELIDFDDPKSRSGKLQGLAHARNLPEDRPLKSFRRGDPIKVKITNISGNKVALSVRDVDQTTGRDLRPSDTATGSVRTDPAMSSSSSSSSSFSTRPSSDGTGTGILGRKKQTQHSEAELWEIRQLINSGVLPVEAYPTFHEEQGVLHYDETEEELEIEKDESEPTFLRGQTQLSNTHLSQIKVAANPEGSMQRAALNAASIAKERRDMKRQEAQEQMDRESAAKADNRPWLDPMADRKGQQSSNHDIKLPSASSSQIPEWKQMTLGQSASLGIVTDKSIKEQRESLPIFSLKNELIKAFRENQVLVVIGETGSGKTTQMTQYLAEIGFADRGIIGCTQPRRVAAVSVAKRVAEEHGCLVGQQVGYTIRFEDCTGPETIIKYMTDGMLMREYLMDVDLKRYSVLMLDEAHERTIHTDVLMGLLKKLLLRRKDLHLIVTSATLDADKFSSYFFNCPIFTIPGRTFPVDILFAKEPEPDYLEAALITVMQIHLHEPPGDILLFLTGQEEIETACEVLYNRMKSLGPKAPELLILPAYGSLPSEMQSRIFEPAPPGARKLVVATNIAEASITLDGVFYVIDPGFTKENVYNPKLGMDSLVVVPTSQASARQRAGRAGRTGPGKCYRLYTELAYKTEMLPTSVPEIQRTNLASVVLQLKAMGINDLLHFDFMDPPPAQTLIAAMEKLYALGALDEEGLLTRTGRKMAEFPLDPVLAKTLIASVELGCADEVVTVVAMLSVENIFYRPKDKQAQADQKKARFHQPEGDHLTLLAVYEGWKNSRFSNPWCYENFIQSRSIRRAQDIRKQLLGIMDRHRMPLESCGKNYKHIQMAIASGFFTHTAKRDPTTGYRNVEGGQPVYIHPSSALFNRNPQWVIYHELVMTTKEYMRNVMTVDPKWLLDVAPNYFKTADPKQVSKIKKREKIEPLHDKYNAPDSWRLHKRRNRR